MKNGERPTAWPTVSPAVLYDSTPTVTVATAE